MQTVCVRDLWKIFGKNHEQAREMADGGVDRGEIQSETGCLVGVRDISFEVDQGETFVVMGLSGSGKSTLVRCMSRLVEPSEGNVEICGSDITAADTAELREMRRHKMSMVFQHFALFPHRRVVDNVAYGLEVQGVDRNDRQERARELLSTVGLDDWGDHYPQQLSGGMQQRVGLARALATDPEVMFFDEPFSALDPLIRRDMQDEFLSLQERLKLTLIFITHDFEEALRLADRIAIMRDGEFVQVGTAAEILTEPAADYVRAFTQHAPIAKVLLASAFMRPLGDAAPDSAWGRISTQATLEEALPPLLASANPLVVTDKDGEPVGLLYGEDVAEVVSGNNR